MEEQYISENYPRFEKIRFILKSYNSRLIDVAIGQIINCAQLNSQKIVGPVPLPTKRRIYCVLRSPHVNKDSREQFEIRVHKRLLDIKFPLGLTITRFRKLDISAGVGLQVKTFPLLN